jgi:hypothetical protein
MNSHAGHEDARAGDFSDCVQDQHSRVDLSDTGHKRRGIFEHSHDQCLGEPPEPYEKFSQDADKREWSV